MKNIIMMLFIVLFSGFTRVSAGWTGEKPDDAPDCTQGKMTPNFGPLAKWSELVGSYEISFEHKTYNFCSYIYNTGCGGIKKYIKGKLTVAPDCPAEKYSKKIGGSLFVCPGLVYDISFDLDITGEDGGQIQYNRRVKDGEAWLDFDSVSSPKGMHSLSVTTNQCGGYVAKYNMQTGEGELFVEVLGRGAFVKDDASSADSGHATDTISDDTNLVPY